MPRMTDIDSTRRLVLGGGLVFDGRATDLAPADVAIQDGRIVDVGSGLDGDERIDVGGHVLLPGLFDCHTHVMLSTVDHWRILQQPFSYQFYEAARNMGRRSTRASRRRATPTAPTWASSVPRRMD